MITIFDDAKALSRGAAEFFVRVAREALLNYFPIPVGQVHPLEFGPTPAEGKNVAAGFSRRLNDWGAIGALILGWFNFPLAFCGVLGITSP